MTASCMPRQIEAGMADRTRAALVERARGGGDRQRAAILVAQAIAADMRCDRHEPPLRGTAERHGMPRTTAGGTSQAVRRRASAPRFQSTRLSRDGVYRVS